VKLLLCTSVRTFVRAPRRTFFSTLAGGLLFVVCASAVSFAGDSDHGREFNGVVKAIENHYGVRHTHIPFVGLVVSVAAHPAGVSNFRLAVFEDFHPSVATSSASADRTDDLQDVVGHSLGSDWTLFVRTRTKDDADDALIYVNLGDGKLQMLIVSIEPDEATVVEMNLSEQAMLRWIAKESSEEQAWHHRHHAED
jgi:hypothetical protein